MTRSGDANGEMDFGHAYLLRLRPREATRNPIFEFDPDDERNSSGKWLRKNIQSAPSSHQKFTHALSALVRRSEDIEINRNGILKYCFVEYSKWRNLSLLNSLWSAAVGCNEASELHNTHVVLNRIYLFD